MAQEERPAQATVSHTIPTVLAMLFSLTHVHHISESGSGEGATISAWKSSCRKAVAALERYRQKIRDEDSTIKSPETKVLYPAARKGNTTDGSQVIEVCEALPAGSMLRRSRRGRKYKSAEECTEGAKSGDVPEGSKTEDTEKRSLPEEPKRKRIERNKHDSRTEGEKSGEMRDGSGSGTEDVEQQSVPEAPKRKRARRNHDNSSTVEAKTGEIPNGSKAEDVKNQSLSEQPKRKRAQRNNNDSFWKTLLANDQASSP